MAISAASAETIHRLRPAREDDRRWIMTTTEPPQCGDTAASPRALGHGIPFHRSNARPRSGLPNAAEDLFLIGLDARSPAGLLEPRCSTAPKSAPGDSAIAPHSWMRSAVPPARNRKCPCCPVERVVHS